jgi:hypothetical protein
MEPDVEIIAPDGTVVKFPAGTPDEEILTVMQQNFGGPEDANFYAEPGATEDNPIDLTQVRRDTEEGRALLGSLTKGTWVRGADGTVYALPSNPTTGRPDVGDQPLTPGVYERPFSVAEDVAKSIPTGVVEGLTGMAGLQGTIGQVFGLEPGQNVPGFGTVGFTGEQLNQGIEAQIGGEFYQPQSVAGEYARTLGEFAPGAIAPGSAGVKLASWLAPGLASETAGQTARAFEGGERDTDAENWARLGGGLGGGLLVGGTSAVRSGADNVLRNAVPNVTPQQLDMAAALSARAESLGIPLTRAEALQQVTGGATGLGRMQRVVEGANSRLAPMMAQRPERVDQAIAGVLDQIGPAVEPSVLAPQVRDAAGGVLNTLRRRANEDARPFYDRLPGQSIPPEQFQQLTENPSFAAALRSVRGDEELAPLLQVEAPPRPAMGSVVRYQGQDYTGPTHLDAIATAPPELRQSVASSGERLFSTPRGGTLDRFRAQNYAVRNGLIRDDAPSWAQTSPELISENLATVPGGRTSLPDENLSVINEVVKQLGTMADEAAPSSMRVGGSMTRAAQRTEAQRLADELARQASPDYAMARDTVRGVNEAFIDPLKAGPIGALADTSEAAPNLGAMTGRLFPSQPFEGQAQETARALQLMGEIDPSVGGPLVRQHLARMAAEANQSNVGGANQFGGAKFAAQAFGNPLQRDTVLGAVDTAAPMASRDLRDLVEALSATGQREAQGSQTSFNAQMLQDMRGGNVGATVAQGAANPLGMFGAAARGIDDWTARRNAETLADLLMANSDEFSARLTRATNRPRGANRIRAGVAVAAGQED